MKICTDCGKKIESWFSIRCPECNEKYKAKLRREDEEIREKEHKLKIKRMEFIKEYPFYCNKCLKRFRTYEECEEHENVCRRR